MKYEHYRAKDNILQVYERKKDIPDPHEVRFCVELIPRQFWVALIDSTLFVWVIIVRIIVIIRLRLIHHFFQLTILYVYLDLIQAKAQKNEHSHLCPQVFNALLTFLLVHFLPGFVQARSLFHQLCHFYAVCPFLGYFVVFKTFLTLLLNHVTSRRRVLIARCILLS